MSLRRAFLAAGFALAACARSDSDGADSAAPAAASTTPSAVDLALVDRSRQMGSDSAKVWFIMGSDFQCPYCRAFHHDTWPRIEREYVRTGRIRVAFMHHPMSFHALAIPAAEAAMCAGAQDKFWPMHDSLFVNQEKWAKGEYPQSVFESLAKGVGLDIDSWRSCMSSHATRSMVELDFSRTSQIGIQGTPSFVIGDSLAVVGAAPYADFKNALDAALARAGR